MKRISVLVLVLCTCFASVAWGQQVAAKGSADWTEFHRTNMERSNPYEHVLNVHNVGGLQLKWAFTTKGDVYSSPAVVNGVVYVGSGIFNSVGGEVYAVKASTGAKLWSYRTGAGGVESSPAVANGVVYVGSNDYNVYALNAKTGAKLWSYTTGAGVFTAPAVVDGVVYAISSDSNLYALNANTGALLWSYSIVSLNSTQWSSPAVANGVIYFASNSADDACDDPNVFAVKASTGTQLWSYAQCGYVVASPAVANGVVYIGTGDTREFYALDARTGAVLWSNDLGNNVSPAVANGVLYIGAAALNARTGAQLWSYNVPGPISGGSSPAVVNGVVYVGSGSNKVYAFGLKKGQK